MPQQDASAPVLHAPLETTVLDLGHGRTAPAEVRRLRVLGSGRASRALLVEVVTEEGSRRVAEKHFSAAGLTRAIYKAAFGAPFPYGENRDAALACLYRRRVAGALLLADEGWRVAEALYVRRCAAGHFVLGTEWIDGRPVAPPKPQGGPEGGGEPGEMRALLRQMRAMERCLLRSGLVGSGWQVATAAIVATANLLRNKDGEFVCVDLESGIPAILVPRYALLALTGQPFPLFDDVDERRLTRYLAAHRDRLRTALGDGRHEALEASAARLVEHSRNWKRTEPAPGRHRAALLFDEELRATIRGALAMRWHSEGRLDEAATTRLRESRLLFLQPLVVVGMIPTPIGTLFHRLVGNRAFRARFRRAVLDPRILDAELRAMQSKRVDVLRREGRIPQEKVQRLTRGFLSAVPFAAHTAARKVLPARIHRYLADRRELGSAVKFACVTLFSEELQERLAASFVESAARRWRGLGRIDEAGRAMLVGELERGEAPEYVRGFGMHLALKFFAPVTGSLKAIGLMLLVTPWRPLGIILIVNTSIFRMMITTYRWMRRRDPRTSYAIAFAISPLPWLGTLAFPLQFYHRSPWLCRFLVRNALSGFAGAIPVYGGTATRLEHALVRLATPLTAVVAAIVWPLSKLGRRRSDVPSDPAQPNPPRRIGWLGPHVDQAMAWLSRTEKGHDPCASPGIAPGD